MTVFEGLGELPFYNEEIDPAVGAQGDEIVRGIAGNRRRPLHLADLSRFVGRNRDDDVGEGEAARALAVEHDAGRDRVVRPRRRHHHVDGARAGRAGGYDDEIAGGTTGAADQSDGQKRGARNHIGLGHAAP